MLPAAVAVIVAVVCADTAVVATVKVAVVAPAATVTELGTVALDVLDESVTTVPPVPAGPLKVTVPVEEWVPVTDVGFKVNEVSVAGLMVRVAVFEVLPCVAVIVAVVTELTAVVEIVKVPVVAPAATVTDAGTVALAVLELKVITLPDDPAGPLKVTVPVEDEPPETVAGLIVKEENVAGLIVSVAVWLVPLSVPVIVAWVTDDTDVVVTVKVAVVCPAGTETLAGTVALLVLDESATTVLEPAGPLRVTVPVDEPPPETLVGDKLMLDRLAGVIVSVADKVVEPWVAVIDAEVDVETPVVVIVNVAELAPPATVTDEGTVALEFADERLTVIPPVGAFPLSVTVPMEEVPPTTEVGDTVKVVSVGGVIVSVAVCEVPARVPVMVADTVEATGVVVIVNVAEVAPAATVTVEGKVALDELEVRLTTEPLGPAAPLRVTVPVELFPPTTEDGETETLLSVAGVTVRVAVWGAPFKVPEMVAWVEVETAVVLMVKVVVLVPAGTVTVDGTVAEALLDDTVTTAPLEPAGPFSVIVPVEVLPPSTDVGLTDRLEIVAALMVNVAV